MNNDFQDDKELRDNINRVIDHELDKPNPDMNLIHAYMAVLNYRTKGKYLPDPKMRREELKKLSKLYKEASKQKESENRTAPKWRKSLLKVSTVVCSIVLVAVLSVFTISAFSGVSPAELLSEFGNKIFQWEKDEPVDINGMTFIKNGEARQYKNIKECVQNEKLDIYYPTWLPDGLYVESVMVYTSDNSDTITLKLNTDSILFGIKAVDSNSDDYLDENYNEMNVDGRVAYYIERDGKYYTKIELDGYIYTITTTNMEFVEKMLSGLKKE